MIVRLIEWLDERTSLPQRFNEWKNAAVDEGRWRSATGAAILLLLLLQFITGFTIVFFYVPSSPHAHTSVLFIIKEVPGGALLRAIHHQSAVALILLSVLYLLQLFYKAGYKNKRELLWVGRVIIFGLILASCFTGQLLPWDQKGYYGTGVGASIVEGLPVVGETMKRLFIGDSSISTLTLSRFFSLHTIVLPAVFLVVFLIGSLIRWPQRPNTVATERYYPVQFAREVIVAVLVFAAVVIVSWRVGSPLEPMADPSDTSYIARPEWYFLPLFQLLKLFPPNIEGICAILSTSLIFALLLAIPFIDRSPTEQLSGRKLPVSLLGGLGLGLLTLAVVAILADRKPEIKAQLARQHEQAQQMLVTPFRPQPIGRATAAPVQDSSTTGVNDQNPTIKSFIGLCAPCHGPQATGGALGPTLIGIAAKHNYTKAELVELIASPASHGLTAAMPGFNQLSKEQREAMADFLLQLDSPQKFTAGSGASTPPELFVKKCAGCHGTNGEGGFGPTLIGIGKRRSKEKISQIIADPASAGLNNMPPFPDLKESERNEIANWLMRLK